MGTYEVIAPFVSNGEIWQELTSTIESTKWNKLLVFQWQSENLIYVTLDMETAEVAISIEKTCIEYVYVIQYNN